VNHTVLLVITTLSGDNLNWFNRVITKVDENNNPLVKSEKYTKICDDCLKKFNGELKECPHRPNFQPDYKDQETTVKWGKVLKSMDKDNVIRTEFMGINAIPTNSAFNAESIDWMFDKKNFFKGSLQVSQIPRVIVTVDPNAGGKNFAAISIGVQHIESGDVIVSIYFSF